jgi:hypothetical protein
VAAGGFAGGCAGDVVFWQCGMLFSFFIVLFLGFWPQAGLVVVAAPMMLFFQ